VEEVHLFARIACFKVEANKARYRIDVLRKLGDKRFRISQVHGWAATLGTIA
jgi:hypothetical protein